MNPINLTFVLAVTMTLVLIRLATVGSNIITTNAESFVVSNPTLLSNIVSGKSNYFEGEQSDPALADLIVTNNEKIVYETNPYPLNPAFQARAAAIGNADGRPRGEGSDMDPTVCLYERGQNMVSDMYGVNGADPTPGYPTSQNEGMNTGMSNIPPHTMKKDILYMYDQLQGPIDLGMANKMIATDKHAKQSFTNRSRMNRRAFNKYFVQELEEASNRGGWWDNDELDMEM